MKIKDLNEKISQSQIDNLEIRLDKIWDSLGMDIEFTKHFVDRVNHERNKPEISIDEIESIFIKAFSKYGKKLKNMKHGDVEAVLNDISNNLNIPFVLKWNRIKKELELVNKTIMRKKDFKTPDQKFVV